jgi:type IV secretory pathway TraG/TraD family ATPase VirD4
MARLRSILALWALLCCGGLIAVGQDPPPIPENVTRADYLRDVGRAAQLALHEAEIGFKYNAGKITGEAYYPDFTKTRKELNDLRVKWGQVSPKMGVQFVFDYRQRSDRQIAALRGQYAPKPVEKPKPREVYRGEPEPAPKEPYQSTPEQRRILFWGIVIALALFVFIGLSGRRKPDGPPPGPMLSDNYGSASFAPQWNIVPNAFYPFKGVFFGKSSLPEIAEQTALEDDPGAPVCAFPEFHTLIVARTRTGKGTRVIVPTLLRYLGSMIVIDPKGENAAITARARKLSLESTVHILNPWGLLGARFEKRGFAAATYNPLDVLDRNDPNVVAIAQTLASTISPTWPGDKDKFWSGSAANVIAAVLLWITDQPGETKTLARAREILSLSRKQFTEQFMTKMAASRAFDGAIKEMISPYLDLADETYSGIFANIGEATKFLSDPQVKISTATSSFDMADLISGLTTVYVVIPPERVDTQKTWLRLLITAATATFKQIPSEGRENKHRTMFLIDEFPALGRMPDLPRDIATMSGYGVDYTLIVQGLDQLKDQYHESAGAILSNCAYKWFCNVNDLESAKYLSESLGQKTVQTTGKSVSKGVSGSGQTEGESTTTGEAARNLMNPDEILTLGRGAAILLNPTTKPQYLRPVDYWELAKSFEPLHAQLPHLYWEPELVWDANPYVSKSSRADVS